MLQRWEYIALNDKEDFFQTGSACISTAEQFDFLLPHLMDFRDQGFVFRGVNEARYMLYNSGQRKFIDDQVYLKNISYREFILGEIEQFKSANYYWLHGYMQKHNIAVDNFLAVLSIMQQKGSPSPCIDFSFNPLVALYFSFFNSKDLSMPGIDSYVSIYFFSKHHLKIHFVDLSKAMVEGLVARTLLKGESHSFDLNNEVPFETLFLLDVPIAIDITGNGFVEYNTRNNPNIIRQQGLLFFSPSPDIPFEEISKQIFEDYAGPKWQGIKCINLNKSLKRHVLERLAAEGVTYELLFPETH